MNLKTMSLAAMSVAVGIMADAAQSIAQMDIWKAVVELGIAITFAVVAFMGMAAFIKRYLSQQRQDELRGDQERREDTLRMANRIDALEDFARKELVAIVDRTVQAIERGADVTRDNMAEISRLNTTMQILLRTLDLRPCGAMECLTPEERSKVKDILAGAFGREYQQRIDRDANANPH